ncbi:MAG: dTDP-4-dehydrorhamnose 3,5-epimerase family protein [Proteobacteria bacterium]|nr:dTDP-4-dehydrorhamnose 3,5-epimerase family protein [Pseudomonadota bacterium]
MQFRDTPLAGALLVELTPHSDARGFFARTWCAREFAGRGLPGQLVQSSLSHNRRRGTVRGMHLQLPPSQEAKLITCVQGAILDVIVDLRPQSPTFLRHFAVQLDAATCTSLFVPPLMAHGFQTLVDDSRVQYQMSDYHAPQLACGWRWNDPAFAIRWPLTDAVVILPRDATYADFDEAAWRQRLAGAGA